MPANHASVLAAFATHVYGQAPPGIMPRATPTLAEHPIAHGTLSEWRLDLGPGLPSVWALLATPNRRPAPCLVGLNALGNHAAHPDPGIRIIDRYTIHPDWDRSRGSRTDEWPIELALARGWAVAIACCGDLQEDRPDGEGLLRAWRGRHSAGAIAAWAWGLSRMADWLVTRPEIDTRRLVVAGHSRLGKTTLLAAASDPRFAMAIPSQSGSGGVAPSHDRSPGGQPPEDFATSFPYWFNPAFYTQTVVEQHELLATIAPRPVLVTNATDDPWSDPAGQWRTLRRAAPAWGISLPERPPPVGERHPGPLAWWMRPGRHGQTSAEVRTWLDAADEALGA